MLDAGVGGHDRPSAALEIGSLQSGHIHQECANLLHRILATDHTGRGDHQLLRINTNCLGHSRAYFFSVGQALEAGSNVRVASDHHDASRSVTLGDLAGQGHTRTCESGLGEHRTDAGRYIGDNRHEIILAVLDT